MGKIQYKLKQYKNASSAYNNFFYPRAVAIAQMTSDEVAESIQKRCSLTRSDVVGCLAALAEIINEAITNSMSVHLAGIGHFRAGIVTDHMVETLKEFNVSDCIKGYKINFLPEFTSDASGRRTTKLLVGAGTTEYAQYAEGINDTKKVGSGTSAKRVAIELAEKA